MKVINKKIIIIMISIFISFYCDENSDGNNVNGCTDSIATNYSNLATNDDGSCEYTLNGVTLMKKIMIGEEALSRLKMEIMS